jgi:hypothetical protein
VRLNAAPSCAALALIAVSAIACGTTDEGGSAAPTALPSASAISEETSEPDSSDASPTESCARRDSAPRPGRVLVFFACEGQTNSPSTLHAFARPVDPAADLHEQLRTAVVAYFQGPASDEPANYFGFGSPGWLNGVHVHGATAVIDVTLRDGYGSTAAQSELVWSTLKALAFQFPSIDMMEPRHNGDCAAFGSIVQAGVCLVARRDGDYTAIGDVP